MGLVFTSSTRDRCGGAGGVALKIRHSAFRHSRGVFGWGTSLALRSLRPVYKSTSKLVLLVLVTRVWQAAFRELRSRRGETINFQENPAGSRVPALVATMGLGSLSIGSFAS